MHNAIAESMRIRVERHVQFSNCAIKTKKHACAGTIYISIVWTLAIMSLLELLEYGFIAT